MHMHAGLAGGGSLWQHEGHSQTTAADVSVMCGWGSATLAQPVLQTQTPYSPAMPSYLHAHARLCWMLPMGQGLGALQKAAAAKCRRPLDLCSVLRSRLDTHPHTAMVVSSWSIRCRLHQLTGEKGLCCMSCTKAVASAAAQPANIQLLQQRLCGCYRFFLSFLLDLACKVPQGVAQGAAARALN